MIVLTASRATSFLALCYAIFADKIHNPTKKPDEETQAEITRLAKEVVPVWGPSIPALREILINILRGKQKEEQYQKLGLILKQLVPQGKADREVPGQELELLHALGSYFRTSSETMASKLVKFASLSKNPWIVQRLAPTNTDQGSTKVKLTEFMQKHMGRKDTAMLPTEAQKLKEIDPDAYKEYLGLRKEFNQAWKDAVAAYVRKSGKHTVPFRELNEYLHLNGIDHLLPVGFTGLVDDMGRYYTADGKLIEGVPAAVNFPSVKMNPSFGRTGGGDWVFMAVRPDGSAGPYFYTSEFKKGQSQAKFAKVGELGKKIDGMRNKWMQQVRKFDETNPVTVAATILELLYEFSARVGSAGNAAHGSATYGVSTLLVKHATQMPDGSIVLRYKGKDGVPTTHKITLQTAEGKVLIHNLNLLLEGKGPKDPIFTYKKGSRNALITAAMVNQLFKACGAPEGTTVHKLRTIRGTTVFNKMMQEQLAKKLPKDEKSAMDLFKKLAESVGKVLNHVRNGAAGSKVTGATALQAYIDPAVQILYWTTVGFRIPKSLEKFDQMLETA